MNIFTKATIYYTRAVAEEIKHNKAFSTQVLFAIRRFYCQDWGETSAEDKAVNENALKYKDFILAAYPTPVKAGYGLLLRVQIKPNMTL